MSDLREPSYYEIALTSRQAFTAFVLLLVCVLASFFAGLWIGRGSAVATPTAGDTLASQGAPPESAMEELKFFGEEGDGAAVPEQPAPNAVEDGDTSQPAQPTLLEQLNRETATSRPAAQEGRRPRQAAQRRPRNRPAPPPEPKPKPTPAPQASEPAPRAAKEEPSSPEASTTAPSGDETIIQVFSSADEAQASRVLDRLKADGYTAYVEPIQEAGKALYRVRIGPFESKEAAEPVAAEVRRKHRLDTWITRAGG